MGRLLAVELPQVKVESDFGAVFLPTIGLRTAIILRQPVASFGVFSFPTSPVDFGNIQESLSLVLLFFPLTPQGQDLHSQ